LLTEEFDVISAKYKLGKLPHYNKTKKYDWKNYYTPRLAAKIYSYYSKDIEMFDYKDDYEMLMRYLNEKPKLNE
jgi:hypothetical protein